MANRVNNNKIFGYSGIVKKDSLRIAGWVTSARQRKDSRAKSCGSRSKFNTNDYSHIVPSINTMTMDSVEIRNRKFSVRSQQKNRGDTIRGTNFKYGVKS